MSNFLISTRSTTSISDSGPQRLEKLKDCLITNPLNNQQLVYESSKGVWRNSNMGGALTSLSDTEITDPIDYNILTYYNDKWINTKDLYGIESVSTKTLRLNSIDNSYKTIDQSFFTGGSGTSISPSFYNYDPTYTSISIDASFVIEWTSYYILLPTTLENGSSIYIQIINVGPHGIIIRGGSEPRENIYVSSNFWVAGMGEPAEIMTYKFTFYSPSSNNPYYGNTNLTSNSWRVDTVYDHIPLKPYTSVYGIDTLYSSSKFILPFPPSLGQIYIIKDISGNASVNNITIDEPIDNATGYIISSNYETLTLLCTQSSINGRKFIKINGGSSPSVSVSKLEDLTDVSVSNPSNDQVLVYTTDSLLNKWTPYTLSGATFNDANKTITISTGSSSLSTLTDCTINTPVIGNLLMHNGTAWVNTDSIPDNLFIFKDDTIGTKRVQFELSGITVGTTRILSFPNATCTIVGDSSTHILTNKTMIDPSNNVLASSLKSATSVIDISSSLAPSGGQVLTATSSTSAIWQTVSTSSLNTSSLAQNATFLTQYNNTTNQSSLPIIYGVDLSNSTKLNPNAWQANMGSFYSGHNSYTESTGGPLFNGITTNLSTNPIIINYYYTSSTTLNTVIVFDGSSSPFVVAFQIWGSNRTSGDASRFDYATGTLLWDENDMYAHRLNTSLYEPFTLSIGVSLNASQTIGFNPSNLSYKCYHFVITGLRLGGVNVYGSFNSAFYALFLPYSKIYSRGNRTTPTDFTLSTDSTTGYPAITKLTSLITENWAINLDRLTIFECYRRVFPVVRDTNTIRLTDGTNTATFTSTSIISTSLKSATTTINVSSATAPSAGQVLTATSSTNATWQFLMSKQFATNMAMVPFSSFSVGNYTILGLCNHYVFNCATVTTTNTISLISVTNGTQIQMQFDNSFGSGGNFNVVVGTSGATNFYTANQVSVPLFNVSGGAVNNTYTFTYYDADLNPWRTAGDHAPSWTVTTNSINAILFSTVNTIFVFTQNNNCDMFIALANPQDGQDFTIRDVGGYLTINSLTLASYNGCVYNTGGATSASTHVCNDGPNTVLSYRFVYFGGGYYLL